jgi:hypothetical protein
MLCCDGETFPCSCGNGSAGAGEEGVVVPVEEVVVPVGELGFAVGLLGTGLVFPRGDPVAALPELSSALDVVAMPPDDVAPGVSMDELEAGALDDTSDAVTWAPRRPSPNIRTLETRAARTTHFIRDQVTEAAPRDVDSQAVAAWRPRCLNVDRVTEEASNERKYLSQTLSPTFAATLLSCLR